MFFFVFFFFKQKTAYEMRISDWSSDVCSSDLGQLCNLRREHVCDRVGVGLVRDGKHFRDAVDLRGLGGDGGRVGGQHDDVDGFRRQRLRGGHALGGGGVELAVEVFGDDQDLGHYSNPFCLSAATSSAASFTITPRLRLAGGA